MCIKSLRRMIIKSALARRKVLIKGRDLPKRFRIFPILLQGTSDNKVKNSLQRNLRRRHKTKMNEYNYLITYLS